MDAVATIVALWLLYWWWLWFLDCAHQNRLERRHYYDPPTGEMWVQPRARYEDSVH